MNENEARLKWIYHFLFVALLIAVFVYKFNDLFLPYFWDELGVYFNCAYYQYAHGLSLLPASVPAEFSRGHPLFFTLVNAGIFKIFGASIFFIHLFNFLVAVILLTVLYITVTRYFGSLSAITVCCLLACQPIFLAQSCLVLPEVMLALLSFLALLFFYEGKYWLFAVFASIAILTKETAVVLPATVILYSLIRFRYSWKEAGAFKPVNILLIISPYLVFGAFLLVQKKQNGWYFFPFHLDNIATNLSDYWSQCRRFIQFLFAGQGRRFWLYSFVVAVIILILKNGFRLNPLILLYALFVITFLAFSSSNFYMERYLISPLVALCFIVGITVSSAVNNKIIIAAWTIAAFMFSLPYFETGEFNYDSDMGYRHEVKALQEALKYTCDIAGDQPVCGTFPGYFAIRTTASGYLTRELHYVGNLNGQSGLFIYCKAGLSDALDERKYKIQVLKTFKDGFAEETVYQLEKK